MYQIPSALTDAIAAGNPQRILLEFVDYDPVVQFSNEDILVSAGVHMVSEFNSQKDLTIGLCPSAEIQFSMLNNEQQLVNFEFGKFVAYIGVKTDSNNTASVPKVKTFSERGNTNRYEFIPLGTFIAHRPDIVEKSIIEVDANDQMTLFDVDMPTGLVQYPTTLSTLATAMCTHVGVQLKSNTFLNNDIAVDSEPEQFENATMRQVLGWIAEAACSIARFTRDGQLEFAWFTQTSKTYDENNYTEFTPSWYQTQAIDGLHIRNAKSTVEYTYGAGTNAYMIQDNPFLRQPEPVDTE